MVKYFSFNVLAHLDENNQLIIDDCNTITAPSESKVIEHYITENEKTSGIITLGKSAKELCIPLDKEITVRLDVKDVHIEHKVKSHKTIKNRINSITYFYKEDFLHAGDKIFVSYDCENRLLIIKKDGGEKMATAKHLSDYHGKLNIEQYEVYSEVRRLLSDLGINNDARLNTEQMNSYNTVSIYVDVEKNGNFIKAGTEKGYPMITITNDGHIILRSKNKVTRGLSIEKFKNSFQDAYDSF